MNKCLGCGAILQSDNELLKGYIPENEKDKQLCMRCFRLQHYNEFKMVEGLSNEDILNRLNTSKGYVFFLVDLLNINEEVLKIYKSINLAKEILISKCDYIPKSIKQNKIKNWLKNTYQIKEDIDFLSSKKDFNIHNIEKVMQEKKITQAYLCGFTNSGKSTLVNKLKENSQITTSVLPNTTIDFIEINLDDNMTLIDTPGFQYNINLYESDNSFIKKMVPKTYLKPITYQLKKMTSILIEDKIRIEILSSESNLTIYMSNLLNFKKVYENNLNLKEFENQVYEIKDNQDLVIKSLGFINFKKECKVKIYIKDPTLIEIRDSLL